MTQIPNGKTELEQKLVLSKRQVEKLTIEFHKLLENKKLNDNKTQNELNIETDLCYRLIQSANELDVLKYPEPEGTFTMLMMFSLTTLILRDKNNKLEHQVSELKAEIKKLDLRIKDMSVAGQRNG